MEFGSSISRLASHAYTLLIFFVLFLITPIFTLAYFSPQLAHVAWPSMHSFSSLLAIAHSLTRQTLFDPIGESPCSVFDLPGKISMAENSSSLYFSAQASSLVPTCRITPENAEDVSLIISTLTERGYPFSVRSGGSMVWAGASNIAAPGIAIDLGRMNTVTVFKNHKSVVAGSGALWHAVYDAAEEHGLTVVGGRSNRIGVGGFLMGGGVASLSPQFGLGSDNVLEYEAVLANGSIVRAGAEEHPDLFFALHAGSTNFAVVTSFKLRAHRLRRMWGGFRAYEPQHAKELLAGTVQFMQGQERDPLAATATVNFGRRAGAKEDFLFESFVYLAADGSRAKAFKDLLRVPYIPGSSSLRGNVNQQNLSSEIDNAFEAGHRTSFTTITVKADVQLIMDIYRAGSEAFKDLDAVSWSQSWQTMPSRTLRAVENGLNTQGISSADGDLLLANLNAFWDDPAFDSQVHTGLQSVIDYAKQTAQERGLWVPWVYLNYALPEEPVYESFGEERVQRLREIKRRYDPDNAFGRLWSGGFKL